MRPACIPESSGSGLIKHLFNSIIQSKPSTIVGWATRDSPPCSYDAHLQVRLPASLMNVQKRDVTKARRSQEYTIQQFGCKY